MRVRSNCRQREQGIRRSSIRLCHPTHSRRHSRRDRHLRSSTTRNRRLPQRKRIYRKASIRRPNTLFQSISRRSAQRREMRRNLIKDNLHQAMPACAPVIVPSAMVSCIQARPGAAPAVSRSISPIRGYEHSRNDWAYRTNYLIIDWFFGRMQSIQQASQLEHYDALAE
ncbi:hypothetical protein COV94_04705, partial [Candidatus Woesearchaeota archaeon CG11_big_fil_rev_8_21_14_0_20_57_5]